MTWPVGETAAAEAAGRTPGPWSAIHQDDCDTPWVKIDSGRGIVADVVGSNAPHGRNLANARLIAAAPDLLAALRRVEGWLAGATHRLQLDPEPEGAVELLADVRTVITKAGVKQWDLADRMEAVAASRDGEARAREATAPPRTDDLVADMIDTLEGLVANHRLGHVDESWWQSARNLLAAARARKG